MRPISLHCRWVLALFLLQSAFALPAQAIEAEALREKLVDAVDLSAAFNGPKNLKARSYASLTVEPEGDRFRVTFADLRILIEPQQNIALVLPTLSFAMTPEDAAGDLFRVTDLALPEQVKVTLPEEEFKLKVETTGLHLDLLWSFALQYYLEMDSRIESTSIYDAEGTKVYAMGPLTAEMNSQPRDDGSYDVSMNAQYRDVAVFIPPAAMAIDHGRAAVEWLGMNLAAYERISRKMQSTAPEEEAFEKFYVRQITNLLAPEMWEGEGDSLFEGTGLRALDPSGAELFGFDSFGFRVGISDIAASLARLSLRMNHKGFRLAPAFASSGGLYGDLFPEETAISLVFDKLPLRTVVDQFLGILTDPAMSAAIFNSDSDPTESDAAEAMMPMFLALQSLFFSSGTSIAINESHYKSTAAEVTLDGQFTLDEAAIFMGWGTLLAEIIGLDNLMGLAQQQMESSDPAELEAAASALGMLSMLQAFGKRTLEEGGKTRHSYKVQLSPAGEVTVNDKLMMGAQ